MSLIPEDQAMFDKIQDIVELYVKGYKPLQIVRKLGVKKKEVDEAIATWKEYAVNIKFMEDRVEELMATIDAHYGDLIRKSYEVVEWADNSMEDKPPVQQQKLSAIKLIADLEAKRIDVMQKSGLIDAAGLGDELAEMEEQKEALMKILGEELCSSCKNRVASRIAEFTTGMVVGEAETD